MKIRAHYCCSTALVIAVYLIKRENWPISFHCIACNSDKGISHKMKDAKAGNLILIACCQNCGLVQLKDVPNELDLFEFYMSKYRIQHRKQDRPSLKHVYRAGVRAISRLKKIAAFIRKNTKLLDIGSGGGQLTFLAYRMGADASGIDPSSGYLEFGRNHHSINAEQKKISQLEDTNSYQIVTMFHVLEQLPNSLKVIRKVCQILKVGGMFVIEVPNLEPKGTFPFNQFFKAHICYFTSLSLIGMLNDNFSVEYIENEDVIFLICQKSNAKKFKRPSEYNPSAVSLANSRFKYKNLKENILNGGLLKIFKKIPGAIKERYFSRGKEPKMILDSFLIRENLANDSQL